MRLSHLCDLVTDVFIDSGDVTTDKKLGIERLEVAVAIKDNRRSVLGPVSRKSRELFGPEKRFVKLRPAYSVKLVF